MDDEGDDFIRDIDDLYGSNVGGVLRDIWDKIKDIWDSFKDVIVRGDQKLQENKELQEQVENLIDLLNERDEVIERMKKISDWQR